jgi:hypothetical protein
MTIEPAAYCPATITIIRERSKQVVATVIAAELGWTVSRLDEIARRHEIELSIPKPAVKTVVEACPPHPDGIQWFRGSGRVVRNGAEATVVGIQIALFDALLRQMRNAKDVYISGVDLAAVYDVDGGRITEAKRHLNARLIGLCLEVESRISNGYRLVDRLPAKQEDAAE